MNAGFRELAHWLSWSLANLREREKGDDGLYRCRFCFGRGNENYNGEIMHKQDCDYVQARTLRDKYPAPSVEKA